MNLFFDVLSSTLPFNGLILVFSHSFMPVNLPDNRFLALEFFGPVASAGGSFSNCVIDCCVDPGIIHTK